MVMGQGPKAKLKQDGNPCVPIAELSYFALTFGDAFRKDSSTFKLPLLSDPQK